VGEPTLNELIASHTRIDRAIVGALRGRDLSGFEIWRWLGSDQATVGLLTEADLYPTLYRLEAAGLLRSDWREGERTRRIYRLTAAAQQADELSRPALLHASKHDQTDSGTTSRTVSPDPETGSWYFPPETDPVAAPEPSREQVAPGAQALISTFAGAAESAEAGSNVAINRYADELGAALDLPSVECDRVRQEVADHLADSVRLLEQEGMDEATAVPEATRRLGDLPALAAHIARSQHSRKRRDRAIERALIELVGEMFLWLAASVAAFVVGPGLADVTTSLCRAAGLHLVVLTSAPWATNQMAAMMCIGAFAAGRLSLGHLARISRHSDTSVRKPWATGGAAAVLAFALLMPGSPDTLVVLTMLAVPLAFVAGTFRPKHQNEAAYTWRGIATAVLLVAVVMLLPGGRLFAYDPGGTPGAPLAHGAGNADLTIVQSDDGTFGYQPAGTTTFVHVELWPATTEGLFVVVDRSAKAPTVSDATVVDLAKLPPGGQWWVAVVVVGPDGQRTTRAMVIQTGSSPELSNALAWLIGRL
jgi:DNA-binding MarR family transcriptional regulator